MLKNKLITIENFNKEDQKEIAELLEHSLKQKVILIDNNEQLTVTDKVSFQEKLLQIQKLQYQQIKESISNHLIVASNYFDSLFIHDDFSFFYHNITSKRRKFMSHIYEFYQEIEPDLTLVKKSKDKQKNKRIGDLLMLFPDRCKILESVNKKEIIEHLLFLLKK